MNHVLRLGLASLLVLQGAAAQAVTGMKFISSPGDYIGGGTTQTYRAPSASVSGSSSGKVVQVSVGEGNHYWSLTFAAPDTLVRGSYADAARYPFQSPLGAGIDVSGDGRGCNQIKGWFKVLEIEVDANGAVQRLAVDFEQNCELTMPPLYGAVRINSKRPLTVPDLEAVAGADFAVYAGQNVTLDGSQSFARKPPGLLSYRWTQIAGTPVTLNNPTAFNPSFTAPQVPLAGESLQFQLVVTDNAGKTSRDNVVVLVQNESVPRTSLVFSGDPGDYISQGRDWSYDKTNAVITASRNFDNGISVAVEGATWWTLDTAAPFNAPLAVGTYKRAQRFPFQPTYAPGLDLSGDGRGCNTLTGQFTVHQVQYDSGGLPQVADIEFEQHCEGGVPAARGRFLLNAVPAAQLAPRLRDARQRLAPRPAAQH